MAPNSIVVTKLSAMFEHKHEHKDIVLDGDPEMAIADISRESSMRSLSMKDEEDSGGSSWSSRHADDHSTNTGYSPDHSVHHRKPEVTEETLDIAGKENTMVAYWRFLMFGVLFAITVTVGIVVFDLVRRSQYNDFDNAFDVDSEKIYEYIGQKIDATLESIDAMATMIVTSAALQNETFPYAFMPDFPAKASKIRLLSDALAIQQYVYVEEEERSRYEAFAKENERWVQETIDLMKEDTTLQLQVDVPDYDTNHSTSIRYGPDPIPVGSGPYFPTWNTYPIVPSGNSAAYNWNSVMHPQLGPGILESFEKQNVVIGPVLNYAETKEEMRNTSIANWSSRLVDPSFDTGEPTIRILYPILDTADGPVTEATPKSKVVGLLASTFFWRQFIENILPDDERGLIVVFENSCNQSFTYEINGHEAEWLGPGDLHEHKPEFDAKGRVLSFTDVGSFSDSLQTHDMPYAGLPINKEYCAYSISVYPSEAMFDEFITNEAWLYSAVAVGIFAFTTFFLLGYDKLVRVRQKKVMKTAIQSTTIVSSLFPSNIRDRLLHGDESSSSGLTGGSKRFEPTKVRLRSYLTDGEEGEEETNPNERARSNKPIADLFAATTVLFADIAGFTAWSSTREPTQVFTLLEAVYGAFDEIASRRGVFKVETIGDSYVAVTGLPDPRKDHAVAMAKFARDCIMKFQEMCAKLESTLGPETGDLGIRIGLHSGPVTAGVLRGQKSRFQLFGDTVNTASRMESTGKVNRIQVSQATAELLRNAKKSHWLKARDEMVEAKGKGLMITYWVDPKGGTAASVCNTAELSMDTGGLEQDLNVSLRLTPKMERLINWNVDVLEQLLVKIVARRRALRRKSSSVKWFRSNQAMVLHEVKEVIKLPEYDSKLEAAEDLSIVLSPEVTAQLRDYVTSIALMYPENPFHNFQHASHVGMSVAKLLSRIVAPDIDIDGHEDLHDHTYGITSDPLTQFACVFAALIHDADHPGVPNAQLVKEETDIARLYEGKSVAEQNSINLAWNLLLQERYSMLRNTICKTQQEAGRFRQLVVNAVCATDIIDKDLKAARNKRWDKAFSPQKSSQEVLSNAVEQTNRKATIVIEHLIQASDVAHTMQHWHIYVKWNERFYAEMYKAYSQGRAEKDPTDSWYEGELGFFDFYVIPLAEKLAECGVFGVSSDEYLNYAVMNRNEWEKKGKEVVADYVRKYKLDASDSSKLGEEKKEMV